MVAYLLAPRVNWVPLQHPGYAAYSQPYTQLSVIPPTDADPVIPAGLPGARKRQSELVKDERRELLSLVEKLDTEVLPGLAITDHERDGRDTEC